MSRRFLLVVVVLLVLVFTCTDLILAQYASDSVGKSIDRITDWVTKVLGGGLVIIGAVVVGIRMSMGDREALQKGVMVIVGGLVIFLSKDILNLIRGFAGK